MGHFFLSVALRCIYVAMGFFLALLLARPSHSFLSSQVTSVPALRAMDAVVAPSAPLSGRVLPAVAAAVAPCMAPAAAPPPPPPARGPAAHAPLFPPTKGLPLSPPRAAATGKAFFVALVARLVALGALGNSDAGMFAHYLSRYYLTRSPEDSSGSVWDIGANKGDTSQVLISALVPGFFCHRFYGLSQTAGANCLPWFFPFYGVEMNPPTAAVLRKRAEFERWDLLSYTVVEAGFSDAPGEARLAAEENSEGSEVASLLGTPAAGGKAAAGEEEGGPPGGVVVPLHSVDSWRAGHGEVMAPIFLLKIDTEGFDGKVIKGAEEALAGGHVKFLVAEYNAMWAGVLGADGVAPQWSLRTSTAFLWGLGYECHLLNDQHLVPLWAHWWHDSYEFWGHSNFICARHCDADMLHLVAAARNASLPLLERPDCP